MSIDAVVALISALLLLLVSGFVSGSEIAYFSLSPQDIHEIENNDAPQDALVKSLLHRSEYLLATILIVNNLVNIAIIVLCNYFISSLLTFPNAIVGFLFQTVILTFILLLFCEIMPKIYASHHSLRFARQTAWGLTFFQKIFTPLAGLMVRSTKIVNKHISRKNVNISMDELSQALEMTSVDMHEEKALLEGILKFGGKTVEEIMISRVDMTDVDIHMDYTTLMKVIVETGYSRLPVYEGSEDCIKGIIYIKDLLPYIGRDSNFAWQRLLRPAYFVPETKMIDDLLEEFRTQKIHMAIVVDEFGGTSGIVTMEDILEEIVGEISDEYDDEERNYVKIDDHTFIFEGKILLNDFYKITGVDDSEFEELTDEAETLAGLILEIKGDFPDAKEKISYGRFRFIVLDMDRRRILKVKVKIEPEVLKDE